IIDVVSFLADVPDQSVTQLNIPRPGQVGAIPGTPSVEGGAATYRVPIEIPPGRAGMQPEVALTYSSRGGNGIAGVGWSFSATHTIYRCPRTLSQDTDTGNPPVGNRPVQHDGLDRLCFDGQRLISSSPSSYGSVNTEYRTEIDQYDKITLK